MIEKPMDVLHQHPIRKSGKQKKTFREDVLNYIKAIGYDCAVEKGSFGAKNVIIGDPSKAKYILTAHYDTPATMPFPNLITPCSFWLFMGYQLFIVLIMFAMAVLPTALVGFLIQKPSIAVRFFGIFLIAISLLLMFGPANKHNANDNTSGVVTVLETAKNLPEAYRDQICFVLFDLEEAGLLGSAGYASKHKKQVKNQLILNLDCVGDGNEVLVFPNAKVKKHAAYMSLIDAMETVSGEKSVKIHRKGFSIYPSDQGNFPYGVAFSAMHRSKSGILYCDKIHTNKDIILEEENVRMLSDRICNALKNLTQKEMKGEVVLD